MTVLRYWLPITRVRVDGITSAVYSVDWTGHQVFEIRARSASVSSYAVADDSARARVEVNLADSVLGDRSYELSLYPDGRLSAFTFAHVDRLAETIASIGKVVGAVATVGLALVNPAVGVGTALAGLADDTTPLPIERQRFEDWAAARPDLATRAGELHSALTEIDSNLLSALKGAAIAAGDKPLTATDAPAKAWSALRAARDELQEELDAIEASVSEWFLQRDKQANAQSSSVAIADIPTVPALPQYLPALSDAASAELTKTQPWVDSFGVRLMRADNEVIDSESGADGNSSTQDDIRLRLSRLATVGVYVEVPGERLRWRLKDSIDVSVVDQSSRVAHLPISAGRGGKTMSVAMSDDGTVASVSYSKASSAAAVTGAALAGADGLMAGITSGAGALTSIVTAREAAQKLTDEKTKRLAELTLEKQLVEAQTAYASSVAARRLQERQDRLAAHIQKLETQGVTGWEG